jgi:hypothetical protein
VSQLTLDECRTLLECIGYSIKSVKDYPHQEREHKEASLKPLLVLQEKLRDMRDEEKARKVTI